MIIELKEYEKALAEFVGKSRYTESRKLNLNESVRGYNADSNTRIQNDIEGAGAELAAAKALNVFWHGSFNVFKGEPDIGKNTQVRQTKYPNGRLIITDKDSDSQYFVLVTGTMPMYNVVGFILGKDAKKKEYLDAPANRPVAYFVPQDALRKIEDK